MSAPTIIDRIAELEQRLSALERGAGTGLSGTDQTIKASHDRLDALLGAGVAAPDGTLVTNLNADMVDGLNAAESGANAHVLATDSNGNVRLDGQAWQRGTVGGVVRAVFRKQIVDNAATGVFRITTPVPGAGNVGGGYACYMCAAVENQSQWAVNGAAKGITAIFARAQGGSVTPVGSNSAVVEIAETASAVSGSSAMRDIGTVTITTAENSETEIDVEFTVDVTGANPGTPYVTVVVDLVWSAFHSPPTLTAL